MRLQADLRSQFLILETVANTTPSLLVVVDTDGRILNQNRATLEVSGIDDEEAIRGRFFWDVFIDPDDREAASREFHAAAPAFAPAPYENTFTNARGEHLVIEWRSAPITDAAGNVTSIVAGGIDITERKQREVQLQRERDITETLMQAIPSLVVVVDRTGVIVDSGVDETRAGVNTAFRHALGWPDSALVRRSVLDLIDPADNYLALMAIASAANGVPAHERESRWLRADGSRIVVAWTATPVDDVTGRRTSLVLLSGVDVTERKQHEEEIRASRSRIVAAADESPPQARAEPARRRPAAPRGARRSSLGSRRARSTTTRRRRAILVGARDELAAALDELRELARGIHPAVLTDRGLRAGDRGAAGTDSRSPWSSSCRRAAPAPIEAAAYYVSPRRSPTWSSTRALVDGGACRRARQPVTVAVSDDGVGGADPEQGTGLRGLADRVAALDGTLLVESPPTAARASSRRSR